MEYPHPDPPPGEFRLAGRAHHGHRWCDRRFRPALSCREDRRRSGERAHRPDPRGRASLMLNRFTIPLGVFALLVVVLAIGIAQSPDKGLIKSPLLGKPAPEFSLPSLTDASKTVSSSDLKG